MPDTFDATDWLQATVDFTDPAAAEHVGVHHLAPALDGLTWFLTRKGAWRCRIHLPDEPDQRETARARATEGLHELATAGTIKGWTRAVYEPEIRAFGGEAAMDSAHSLFCADTGHILAFLAPTGTERDRRREVSLLLCRTLMRAAGLDHYEQGDVWHRVSTTRPLSAGNHPSAPKAFDRRMHRLLSADPGPEAPQFTAGGAFHGFASWAHAFQVCGSDLAALHTRGRLDRGLRAVIAHHVLFHWNRLGLPAPVQAVLSHAAARVTFDPEVTP